MNKKDRKRIKQAVERETLLREFTRLTPAWDFLSNHPDLNGQAPLVEVVNDRGILVKVYRRDDYDKIYRESPYEIRDIGVTFEKAVIGLANYIFKHYGDGKNGQK